jgi:hypothetical protein
VKSKLDQANASLSEERHHRQLLQEECNQLKELRRVLHLQKEELVRNLDIVKMDKARSL